MIQKSKKLNVKKVVSGIKLSLWLTWCWPIPKNERFKINCMKLYQDLYIILMIGLEVPLIYATVNHINDLAMFIELVLQQAPLLHVICNTIFHKVNYHHIQNVVFEMEHFCDSMKPREEIMIQQYIDKCGVFYGASVIVFYLVAVIICLIMPSILHEPFPVLAEYPFDVYHEPLKTIIYVHHTIVGFIASGQLCLNTFVTFLLWFASARFEVLIEELRAFTNIYQLNKYIKKHQAILEYTAEVIIVARSFALTCICCSTVNLIIIGVSFLTDQSVILKIKYIFMILACLAKVFMFTWPAEHLIFLSNDMCQAAFDTQWYNQSIEIRKLLQIIITRSQKVITIAVSCITPSVSFNYLTSYCSTIMSYFTTLRVLLNTN